ncbi:ROK family protein [Paenibacillus tritici]|uniref:ROK family protein n=1 Tax=Paenibacillus tritici TaxID=1873425 RepID=A0ABX2DV49_9BACL|nr:ROK family protein [Paenibacillus tritici]NQX47868.1 ROK family protein [Paenibacillus tritici]
MRQVIGVDIGGTGIKGLVVDESGTVLAEAVRDTEARLGREAILGQLQGLVEELLTGHPAVEALGIASAGRINMNSGEVVYATDNLPGWQGMQLTQWAMAEFGLPAAADNDANAALLGEVWLGAGRGKPSLVMLTLGTGVGGANLADGRLLRGASWSGGDWGHSVLVPGGRPCNCGKQGCAEQYVSGNALLRLALEQTGITYTHGREIMAAAGIGDTAALAVLERFTADLALVIGNIAASVDPEWIIIGGGVIQTRAVWWPMLAGKLGSGLAGRVAAAELGNRAGCFGAARLVLERLGRDSSGSSYVSDKEEIEYG